MHPDADDMSEKSQTTARFGRLKVEVEAARRVQADTPKKREEAEKADEKDEENSVAFGPQDTELRFVRFHSPWPL
jgi:hypothetical protein